MAEEYGLQRKKGGKFEIGNKAAVGRGPNKVSTKVKESLLAFLEDNIDSIQESFDTLKPLEKLQFITTILPYVTPKLSSIESENETKLSGGISISWQEPPVPNTDDKGSD